MKYLLTWPVLDRGMVRAVLNLELAYVFSMPGGFVVLGNIQSKLGLGIV